MCGIQIVIEFDLFFCQNITLQAIIVYNDPATQKQSDNLILMRFTRFVC